MAWKCVADGSASEDIRKDHKTAKHIERYAISEQAIYFEGKYLPLSRIQSVRVQPSSYFPAHSCGKGLPVFKINETAFSALLSFSNISTSGFSPPYSILILNTGSPFPQLCAGK